jgi:hypothetical protein
MKRFLIFAVLWPLIFLVLLAGFSDAGTLGGSSIATNLKWVYVWTTIPALLLGVFDMLVAKFRVGFVGVAVVAGATGWALTYSMTGALAAAIPTLVCSGVTGWAEGRWTLAKEKHDSSVP